MSKFEQIAEVVAEQLDCPIEDIKPESSFSEDLKADSLDIVELVMALEEKFDVEIPDEEAETLTTVQSVLDYLDKK